MTLIFSSGGGRLGNQLLNLIHLTALSCEYSLEIKKISDLFIEAEDNSLVFKIEKNKIKWRVVSENFEKNFWDKLSLKFFIRFLHILFFFHPEKKSYKIGFRNNYPRFIIGKKLRKDFSIPNLIREAKKNNIVISGWGLRDWTLVFKHKKSIVRNISMGFKSFTEKKVNSEDEYLFIHIRRSDFLNVNQLKELNFSDSDWIKSIIKIGIVESIKKVVIFSDSYLSNYFISSLKMEGIDILLLNAGIEGDKKFLELFVNYLYNAKRVICNASTLVLSISFLYHDYIYLPSNSNEYQKLFLNKAHTSFPSLLNWK